MACSALDVSSILKLPNGAIPFVGFGTYLQSNEEAETTVQIALKAGYKHIDTAEYYANQVGIGNAIKSSGVQRSDIYITTKLSPGGLFGVPQKTYEDTIKSLKTELEQLQMEYVDLYLIHHPACKDERLNQYRALVDLQKQGLVKDIGVSNFSAKHIDEIVGAGLPLPAVNQIEIHPLCTQIGLIEYLKSKGIVPVAYSSLAPASTWRTKEGEGNAKDLQNEAHIKHASAMKGLAEKYSVSEAQLLLKWALQHQYVILPKSTKEERIKQNIDLYSFRIDEADLATMDSWDCNAALAWPIGNPLSWE